jgi:hypothetical protein
VKTRINFEFYENVKFATICFTVNGAKRSLFHGVSLLAYTIP